MAAAADDRLRQSFFVESKSCPAGMAKQRSVSELGAALSAEIVRGVFGLVAAVRAQGRLRPLGAALAAEFAGVVAAAGAVPATVVDGSGGRNGSGLRCAAFGAEVAFVVVLTNRASPGFCCGGRVNIWYVAFDGIFLGD